MENENTNQKEKISEEDLKRLTDFFGLLIQIDRRNQKGGAINAGSKTNAS